MSPRQTTTRRTGPRKAAIVLAAATATLLLLTACYLWLLGGTAPNVAPAIGGSFTLTQDNGQVVTDRDFRGRYLLIYFGYTSCPDVCPTTLSAVADAMEALGPRANQIVPLFITVDPERDTPALMHNYLRGFGPSIVGLSGSPAEIQDVERKYRISAMIHQAAEKSDYQVDHTAVLFLVGPDGRYLTAFPASDAGGVLAAKIARYVHASAG